MPLPCYVPLSSTMPSRRSSKPCLSPATPIVTMPLHGYDSSYSNLPNPPLRHCNMPWYLP